MALEPHYSKHVGAMTREGLHAKSDIAAELAWRDTEIERLIAERDALREIASLAASADKNRRDKDWRLMSIDIAEAGELARAALAQIKEQP